jgi:mannose-6-phosphate isomerase-like protein (cupin superfamily)
MGNMTGMTWVLTIVLACGVLQVSGQQKPRQQKPEPVIKNPASGDFRQSPIMPPCFSGALQRINSSTGGAIFLVRAEQSGCTVPMHWHTSGEQITVVSGTVIIKMSDGKSFELTAGGYAYMPARHFHVFQCSGACLHFVQSDGPYDIHYVDRQGNEISLEKAIKANL